MKISTILGQIDIGAMALPEFQRGYVWNREQVRGLMASLYNKYPVGGLLVWTTGVDTTATRGMADPVTGPVKLLLDGQQRVTSLYGIIQGRPPRFFDGNAQAFSGLYFSLRDEAFEFYSASKMKDSPYWIDVTELMKAGVGSFIVRLMQVPELQRDIQTYVTRLTQIEQIKEIDLHIEDVTGEDKTIDVVVDIFNRVNSGGTKLSKGDLALAKICAEWPEARQELKERLEKWRNAGYTFRLEWLLRNVNALVTGRAVFSALADVDAVAFRSGLHRAEAQIDKWLNWIGGRLGLDHDSVLGSPASFPVLVRYLERWGGDGYDHRERDALLYWYIHTFLWGRYAGAAESTLAQDLTAVDAGGAVPERLIELLRRTRGELRLRPDDFHEWSRGARFYPLLYMLTRAYHAKDWLSGVELSSFLLGHLARLEMHHIFPKSELYQLEYSRSDVNALANFTFLTQESNLHVSNRDPHDYLAEIAESQPGALESHWIPIDPALWSYERYHDFLAARRELLAEAANKFLNELAGGSIPETEIARTAVESVPLRRASTDRAAADEDQVLRACNHWVVNRGLPAGEYRYELLTSNGIEPVAVLDLAWPNGLQEGLSRPVALLLDEGPEVEEETNRAGFLVFMDQESFREYVEQDILVMQPLSA